MEDECNGGGGERRSLGGRISQEVQQQARQRESPVVSELLVAARKGHTERVTQLLREEPGNASVTDKHGRTSLHLACISGHLHTVLAILQSGTLPIDCVTKRGHTALHEACLEGHFNLSLLLISLGSSLQARSREGWTPLMCACSRGHLQLVEIVAAAGGKVNDLTRMGLTPLHIAAWKGHTAVVERLLSLGCNPAAVASSGKTAQQLASEEEHSATVTILQAATTKMSQDPTYRISSLEGQLRLCQEKLTEAHTHHDQLLAAKRSVREEIEMKLKIELEQERTRVAELEAKIRDFTGDTDDRATGNHTTLTNGAKHEYSPRVPRRELIKSGSPIIKSASSSNLSTVGNDPTSPSRHLPTLTSERVSITDMVTECMHNPSSMVSIRSNLKADKLTPRIQRKFRYKTNSAALPAVRTVPPSPLTQNGSQASETTAGRPLPKD